MCVHVDSIVTNIQRSSVECSRLVTVCAAMSKLRLLAAEQSCSLCGFLVWFGCCLLLRSVLNSSCVPFPADLDDDEASTERSIPAVSPIPTIVTTAIKDDDCREWGESESQLKTRNAWHLKTIISY